MGVRMTAHRDATASAVYEGVVRHRRHAPRAHGFRYRMAQLWLDLDEVDHLFDRRWLWSSRRPNLAQFRRSDYMGPTTLSLATMLRFDSSAISCSTVRTGTSWKLKVTGAPLYVVHLSAAQALDAKHADTLKAAKAEHKQSVASLEARHAQAVRAKEDERAALAAQLAEQRRQLRAEEQAEELEEEPIRGERIKMPIAGTLVYAWDWPTVLPWVGAEGDDARRPQA